MQKSALANRARIVLQGLALALLAACSDSGGGSEPREAYLDRSVAGIVKDGLSAKPSAEFRKARNRVDRSLEAEVRKELGRLDLMSTTGKELTRDVYVAGARDSAAKSLGVKLDPNKVSDALAAARTLEVMLSELSRNFEGVTSCDALEDDKVVDCVVTMLLAEVKRSERGSEPEDVDDADPEQDAGGEDGDDEDAGAGTDAGRDSGARSDGGVVTGPSTALWGCDTRDVSSATRVTGVTTDQTWRGLILLSGTVRVTNARLTIEPGTVILMEAGSYLSVGYGGAAASLFAEGTADEPIRFCGRNPTPGYWNALTLEATASRDSVLRHVLIADGGGTNAALLMNGAIVLDDVQVRNSGKDGVWAADFAPGSANLTVEGSKGAPVVLSARAGVSAFPAGSRLTGNTDDSVHLNFLSFDQSTTLRNLGVPYVSDQGSRVTGGTLTIEAGVQYRVRQGTWFDVGYGATVATLQVNGTAAEPVVFSGSSAQPGGYSGLRFSNTVQTASALKYVQIKHAGGDASYPVALYLDAAITLDHVTVSESAGGVQVTAAGFGAGSTSLTVTGLTNPARRPLLLVPDALGTIPPGSSFIGNMTSQIEIQPGSLTKVATVAKHDVPYFIAGTFRTLANSQLTLAAGTEFVVNANVWLDIGYGNASGVRFVAEGTAAAPIRFTGLDPIAGSWQGIHLFPNVSSSSSLRYVEIGHAGGDASYPSAVYTDVTIPIESCRIYASAGFGITKLVANPTDYASVNTFMNVALGGVSTR